MCGIVGAIAQRQVAPILLEGLSRLEYRGYDSAGVCTLAEGQFYVEKTIAKVESLKEQVATHHCPGTLGIAHTRWATHGGATLVNAHPHLHENLALVHNGIIENFDTLKAELIKVGYSFKSQTDTEVLLCLIHKCQQETAGDLQAALFKALAQVRGSYAIALIDRNHPDRLYAARQGAPLVVGVGIEENFIASDVLALLPVTHRFIYLDDGEVVCLGASRIEIFDAQGQPVHKDSVESPLDLESISKGQYRHFMQKEIFEQPQALANTLMGRLSDAGLNPEAIQGLDAAFLNQLEQIKIVACGTSYHAGLVGKYWLEELTGITTSVEIASEYRYRKAVVRPHSLFITISQSGETADTLASLRLAKAQGYSKTLCICNVNGSSLVRESDYVFFTRAGSEIGVASTKAFTTQLLCLLLLAILIGKQRQYLKESTVSALLKEIATLPELTKQVLTCDEQVSALAEQFAGKHHCLFLGRGIMYPIALEGALKLKEISYIHAEGYAAGELKHGPIALIDQDMPVVVVAPDNALIGKLVSNIEEVRARGGRLYIFGTPQEVFQHDEQTKFVSIINAPEVLQPILYTIPLQLLAYHCALINGTDVDQPRNLAKSVTVE
ncbi:MAG: glutamine--fructose-6-phosphate transaminase (isomerizing) [Succinivibrio sp.]|nr:glutamine--fructose-6-phosphate transaminase (isomerizing) [Succinivibrio sp.]